MFVWLLADLVIEGRQNVNDAIGPQQSNAIEQENRTFVPSGWFSAPRAPRLRAYKSILLAVPSGTHPGNRGHLDDRRHSLPITAFSQGQSGMLTGDRSPFAAAERRISRKRARCSGSM